MHLPLYLDVVTIEKGAFRSPSTTVANFTYFLLSIYLSIYLSPLSLSLYIYIYIYNFTLNVWSARGYNITAINNANNVWYVSLYTPSHTNKWNFFINIFNPSGDASANIVGKFNDLWCINRPWVVYLAGLKYSTSQEIDSKFRTLSIVTRLPLKNLSS